MSRRKDELLVRLDDGHQWPIELRAQAAHRYSVQYGQQLKSNLGWKEAAEEFGYCLFHRLECDGLIDRPDSEE
jgi:hypothetical protein